MARRSRAAPPLRRPRRHRARAATAIAQAVLERLCGPRSCEASKASSNAPSSVPETRTRRPSPGHVGVVERCDVGVVDAQHRSVARALALEHAQLGGGVGLERPVPVEVVGRDVEQHGRVGAELLDALELKARELADDRPARLDAAREASRARCRRCPRSALGTPPRSSIAAVSSVVVVLPLVPVMPTIGLRSSSRRYASSTSAHTGMPAERAARTIAASSGTPGLLMSRSAPTSSSGSSRPGTASTPAGASPASRRRSASTTCTCGAQRRQRLGGRDAGAHGAEHDGALRAGEHGVHQVYSLNRR